jgi:hypothetical protein
MRTNDHRQTTAYNRMGAAHHSGHTATFRFSITGTLETCIQNTLPVIAEGAGLCCTSPSSSRILKIIERGS